LSLVSVVLPGRGLCDELVARPEESYRLWWVVVCDLEMSWMRRSWPALGRSTTEGGGDTLGVPPQRRLMSCSFPTITHYLETPGISAWQGTVIGRLHITRRENSEVTGQILYN